MCIRNLFTAHGQEKMKCGNNGAKSVAVRASPLGPESNVGLRNLVIKVCVSVCSHTPVGACLGSIHLVDLLFHLPPIEIFVLICDSCLIQPSG